MHAYFKQFIGGIGNLLNTLQRLEEAKEIMW